MEQWMPPATDSVVPGYTIIKPTETFLPGCSYVWYATGLRRATPVMPSCDNITCTAEMRMRIVKIMQCVIPEKYRHKYKISTACCNFRNSAFCPQITCMGFVKFPEGTAIISLNSITSDLRNGDELCCLSRRNNF